MALRWLTAEEMVAISAAWVAADEPGRAALQKTPLLAALLPNVEKAHDTLAALLIRAAPDMSAISQREAEVDAKHDTLVRGIHGTLTMLAPVSDDREELISLRDKLLPDGLGHTQLSYRGEAGHVAAVSSQIDAGIKARLKAIAVHKKTMLDLVEAWIASGDELGQLEVERARLTSSFPSLAGELKKARTVWLQTTKALLANAKLAGIDSATDQLLFSSLRRAEQSADGRARGRSASAPTPAPEPAPAPK